MNNDAVGQATALEPLGFLCGPISFSPGAESFAGRVDAVQERHDRQPRASGGHRRPVGACGTGRTPAVGCRSCTSPERRAANRRPRLDRHCADLRRTGSLPADRAWPRSRRADPIPRRQGRRAGMRPPARGWRSAGMSPDRRTGQRWSVPRAVCTTRPRRRRMRRTFPARP